MNENPTPEQYHQSPQPPQPRTIQVAVPNVKPYVTYAILGVTVLIYLLQLAGLYLLKNDVVALYGVKYGPYIRAGQIWRLITPVFLHDSSLPYGLLHIGFNMYALFLYGRGLEARFGHWRFTLLYFLSAYAGNVFSFLLTPNLSLGASTAVFGLLAAEGMFVFQNRQLLGNRANRALMNVLYVAGINLLIGFSTSGVDNFGHLGGLLGGVLFTWFGGPRWKMDGFYPSVRLIDEREGHGAFAGAVAVLLFFIPLTVLGVDLVREVKIQPADRNTGSPNGKHTLRNTLVTSALLLSLVILAFAFRSQILTGIAGYLIINDKLQPADVIFLLNSEFNIRPFLAAELYKHGQAPVIIIARSENTSVVDMGLVPNDTDISVGVMETLGVPPAKIIVLPVPGGVTSTFDEAAALRQYTEVHQIHRIILVTSAFHTRRARWIFNKVLAGLPVTLEMAAVPYTDFDQTNWWKSETGLMTLFNEYVKLVYYFFKYR